MKSLLTKENLKLAAMALIGVVAYLNQVDPLSLCKPVSAVLPGAVSQPLTADAGNQ